MLCLVGCVLLVCLVRVASEYEDSFHRFAARVDAYLALKNREFAQRGLRFRLSDASGKLDYQDVSLQDPYDIAITIELVKPPLTTTPGDNSTP
jgi:hypothetical protein